MRDVFVVGVGMTRFDRHLDQSIKMLSAKALHATLADADIGLDDLEAVWFSNSAWGFFSNQHCIRGEVSLRGSGLEGLPVTNVDNACAGGATAFHHAWLGVASGLNECTLSIGAEKIYNEDKVKMFQAFWTGIDVEDIDVRFFLEAVFVHADNDLLTPVDTRLAQRCGFFDTHFWHSGLHRTRHATHFLDLVDQLACLSDQVSGEAFKVVGAGKWVNDPGYPGLLLQHQLRVAGNTG